jgi:hypothetical protein
LSSFESSSESIQEIINQAQKDGFMSADSIALLEQDENFVTYLESIGQDILDFTQGNYTERMAFAAGYYTELKASEADLLETQKNKYSEDLREYEAILSYKRAAEIASSAESTEK